MKMLSRLVTLMIASLTDGDVEISGDLAALTSRMNGIFGFAAMRGTD